MKLFLRGIIFAAATIFTSHAFSQSETLWTGNATGTFENSNNWTDGVPNSTTDGLIFTGANFIAVGVTGTGNFSNALTVTETTDQQAASLRVGSTYNVDTGDTTAGTINFQLSSGSTLTINQNDFSNPGIEVSNQDTFNLSGGTFQVVNGDIDVGFQQTVTLTGGSTATLSGVAGIGISSGTLSFANSSLVLGVGSGGLGTMTQSGSSTVTGEALFVGASGGSGIYNLSGGNANLDVIFVADGAGSVGTVNQTGGSMSSAGDLVVGEDGGGTYDLSAGTVTVGDTLTLGENSGSSGTINQTGGSMMVTNTAVIGDSGSGAYNLSGGTATFGGLLVDGGGTLTQSGGALTVAGQGVIGSSGDGTYTMSGGTAEFESGLAVGISAGSTGIVNQTGGAVTIDAGESLFLPQAASTYNLNGGSLQVGNISGSGTLNFEGNGTLIAQGATLNDSVNGDITGQATISAAGATANFSGQLSGTGALVIHGDSSTVVNLTAADSYQGGTTINAGTVNVSIDNIPDVGPLAIASGATLNPHRNR